MNFETEIKLHFLICGMISPHYLKRLNDLFSVAFLKGGRRLKNVTINEEERGRSGLCNYSGVHSSDLCFLRMR